MAAQLPSSESELRDLLSSAVSCRAHHIRKDKETITMANVRRLLENDLGLDKFALDAHKSILNPLVDEVLLGADNGASEEEEKEEDDDENAHDVDETLKGASSSKAIKKASHKKARAEDSSEDLNSQEDSHIEAPKKKKQKKTKKEKVQSEEAHGHDSNSHPDISEDSDVSEVKKPKKVAKSEIVKTTQDKKIDRLRKTIKACGLGVPPSIYKKAKQLDEDKQNSFIIKELEGILNRKGLSANATEKEIKAVKRKIAREKDLEGIEMTNIITEPRGRRAASQLFSPVYRPPKPPIREQDSESESESERESESESEEDAKKEDGAESFEDDKKKPDSNKQPIDDKVPDDKKLDDDKKTDDDKKPDDDKKSDDDKEPDDDKKPIYDKCAPEEVGAN